MHELVFSSPASDIYRIAQADGTVLAVKVGPCTQELAPEPHDIAKEARLLVRLRPLHHPNIIELVHWRHDPERPDELSIWMPCVPHTLRELLDSSAFSPHSPPWSAPNPPSPEDFAAVTQSLAFQLVSAVAFLHAPAQGIAHRDVKPANILLAPSGCAKLADFGVAYDLLAPGPDTDVWPEAADALYTQVATGPYRAPELLFGARAYDPRAVDLWALGVTLAEFFRPLRISFEDEQADDSDDERPATKSEDPSQRFVTPPGIEPRADADWAREALFDADNGEIALVWSIFQVRGTPTEATWPGFFDLPNARRIQFREAVPVRLRDRLPNLPSMALSALDTSTSGEEDMIDRLLAYPPEQRLRAEDALQHAWFRESAPLLPVEMYGGRETTNLSGRTLAEIMQIFLPLAP